MSNNLTVKRSSNDELPTVGQILAMSNNAGMAAAEAGLTREEIQYLMERRPEVVKAKLSETYRQLVSPRLKIERVKFPIYPETTLQTLADLTRLYSFNPDKGLYEDGLGSLEVQNLVTCQPDMRFYLVTPDIDMLGRKVDELESRITERGYMPAILQECLAYLHSDPDGIFRLTYRESHVICCLHSCLKGTKELRPTIQWDLRDSRNSRPELVFQSNFVTEKVSFLCRSTS